MSTEPKGPYKAEYSTTIGPGWAVRIGTSEPPVYYVVWGNTDRANVMVRERTAGYAHVMNVAYAAGVEAGRADTLGAKVVNDANRERCIDAILARVAALEAAAKQPDTDDLPARVGRLEHDMQTVKAACTDFAELDTESDWQRRAEIAEAQVEAVNEWANGRIECLGGTERSPYGDGRLDAAREVLAYVRNARERFGAK